MPNRTKELQKNLMALPYTNCDRLTREIASDTCAALKALWPEYGYGVVIDELKKIWTIEKALEFFECLEEDNVFKNDNKAVKTIATYYHRGYNGGVERVQAQLVNLWISLGYKVIMITKEALNDADYPYDQRCKRVVLPVGEGGENPVFTRNFGR